MAVASDDALLSEGEKVRTWKLEQARRLGYTLSEAERVADFDLDIHALEALLARGCSRECAVWILAP